MLQGAMRHKLLIAVAAARLPSETVCQSGNKGKCQNVRDRVATFITKLGGSLMQNFVHVSMSLEIGNRCQETNHACALQPLHWFSERLASESLSSCGLCSRADLTIFAGSMSRDTRL